MNGSIRLFRRALVMAGCLSRLTAGPYSAASGDPANPFDAPVPGFVGPHGLGKARIHDGLDGDGNPRYQNPGNRVNPLFFAWADTVTSYVRSDSSISFNDPTLALGPVTGDSFDVVSLGDLSANQIAAGAPAGSITLRFEKPIRNLSGADFVIFENGFVSQTNTGGAGIGGILAELAYVEVSADGIDFVRFPTTSLTPAVVGGYGSINPTQVHHLAGKHLNAAGDSWGTPFDLEQVGLAQIVAVRLVDIPGNGAFSDAAQRPIYDAWLTFGSGGFDLEAIGSIATAMTFTEWPSLQSLDPARRGAADDPDGDGVPNLLEYAFATLPESVDPAGELPRLGRGSDAVGNFTEFSFQRDERAMDLTWEIQVSEDLAAGAWATLASGSAGAPLATAAGRVVEIFEETASPIRGIGVIRRVTLRDRETAVAGRRFYRVKVSQP